MCSPCGTTVCYKFEDCSSQKGKGKTNSDRPGAEKENNNEKKGEKEIQLKRVKSRELRGGIMYTGCHCIKRNGLQHDCRRTGCQGEPTCLILPDPMCPPSQLSRARGLADPAPLLAHLTGLGKGGTGGISNAGGVTGSSGGKRFIVCELTDALPIDGVETKAPAGKCCKCPPTTVVAATEKCSLPPLKPFTLPADPIKQCCCPPSASVKNVPLETPGCGATSIDHNFIENIIRQIEKTEPPKKDVSKDSSAGGRRRSKKVIPEPCTRPGCLHWNPPSACIWPAPCLADCFEAHPSVGPGGMAPGLLTPANATSTKMSPSASVKDSQQQYKVHLLLPTGCGAGADITPVGLPVLLMKLC